MNLEVFNPDEIHKTSITIGSIRLDIQVAHLVNFKEGIRFGFTFGGDKVRLNYHLEFRNRRDINDGDIIIRSTGVYIDREMESIETNTQETSLVQIVSRIFVAVRSHLRGKHFTFVTDDQYYEIQYVIFQQIISKLGFNHSHLAELDPATTIDGIHSDDTSLGDMGLIMRACLERNSYPDWVRNSIGHSTLHPKSVNKKVKRNG